MMRRDPIPELKRQLAGKLVELFRDHSFSHAAAVLDTDTWRVADLRAGKLERFSVEKLIRYLTLARCDVTIEVNTRRFVG